MHLIMMLPTENLPLFNTMKFMKNQIRFAVFTGLLLVFSNCFGFTSIASIDGQAFKAWWRSSNYSSQKAADTAALEGCRSEARRNEIEHLAKKCKIVTRAKGPGYGAITCGDNGCHWVTGYASEQAAVDGAYAGCSEHYTNCQSKDIKFWEDFAGFPAKKAQQISGGDCRPRRTTLHCKSSCMNGDCVVTYENGCKMRVKVPARYDGTQNQWVYPSPSC